VRRILVHAGAGIAWWTVLFWLWLLLAGEWNRYEWIGGACAATVAAAVSELARHETGECFRVPLAWLPKAGSVPVMVLVDFAILTYALARSLARRRVVRGEFRANEIPVGIRGPSRTGLRAWIALTATFSPNAYVVDLDEEHGTALVHDLIPFRASERPA
jgi:hypothetical protein